MNKSTQSQIIKAAKICGLNAVPRKSYTGISYVGVVYNNAGDSYVFDPSTDIGQAVYMLSILGGSLSINNKESRCTVYLELNPESLVEVSWVTKPKNKDKRICSAVIKCILASGEE